MAALEAFCEGTRLVSVLPMTVASRHTEASLLELLRARHTRSGNGGAGEYAFLTHVRNEAGFAATRTLDALTVSLWPSRGMELHGYELKCSRSDWVRELREPAKAEAFIGRLDRFSLVIADASIVADGELPPTWGLVVAKGKRLVTAVAAPKLIPTHDRISRSWLVCMLRAAGAVPEMESACVLAAKQQAREEGREAAAAEVERLRARLSDAVKQADIAQRQCVDVFSALGMEAPYYQAAERLSGIAAAVRAVVAGDEEVIRARQRLGRMAADTSEIAQRLTALAKEGA